MAKSARSIVDTIKKIGHGKDSFDVQVYHSFFLVIVSCEFIIDAIRYQQVRDELMDILGLITFGADYWEDTPLRSGFLEGMRVFLDNFTKLVPFQYPYKVY